MPERRPDHPPVLVHPPVIFLVVLALGLGLEFLWPSTVMPSAWDMIAGPVLIVLGVVVVALAVVRFRKAGTNLETYKSAEAVVTDGVYRFSRNPIYIGLSLVYAGIGMALDSAWLLVLLLPFLLILHYGVITREERYLEEKFGEAYRRYKASVRRWL